MSAKYTVKMIVKTVVVEADNEQRAVEIAWEQVLENVNEYVKYRATAKKGA